MSATPRLHYAILELGLRCNLKCAHCASASGRPRPQELHLREWQDVVDDLAALGCRAVDLMGGEVLLTPLVDEVGAALSAVGIPWGILTNGWLLDRRRADALVARGCLGIGVSLDGATPETHDALRGRQGSWQRALRALDVVATLPFAEHNRSVLTSVNRDNLAELPAMAELLERRLPGFRWQLNLTSAAAPRLPSARRLLPDDVDQVARFIDGRRRQGGRLQVTGAHDLGYFAGAWDLHDHVWSGCPAGVANLGVQSDGKVKGCLALDERFSVGNVRETRLRELWPDDERMAIYRRFAVEELGPSCRTCVWGSLCRGGCLAYATAAAGRPHEHPHCLWRSASPEQRARSTTSRPRCCPCAMVSAA